MTESFLLADVTRLSGAKRRSVQLWADALAIRAEPSTMLSGSGTHRLFPRDEVIIACCLNGFAAQGMPIGHLFSIGKLLREKFLNNIQRRKVFEDAMATRGVNLLASSTIGQDQEAVLWLWSNIQSGDSFEEMLTQTMLINCRLSTVLVNLNACLALAGGELV